jgi:hypothetical protein
VNLNIKKYLPFIILLTVFLLPQIDAFSQGCSMCTATTKGASEEDNSIGETLNVGILYLMAVPYILFLIFFRKKIRSFFKELGGMYGKK